MLKETELPALIGAGTLADLVGVNAQRLRQLAEDKRIPPARGGFYPCAESLRGLFAHYRGRNSDVVEQLKAEQLRKTTEEADKLAMDNEERRNILVEMAGLLKLLESDLISIRQKIASTSMSEAEKADLLNFIADIPNRIPAEACENT